MAVVKTSSPWAFSNKTKHYKFEWLQRGSVAVCSTLSFEYLADSSGNIYIHNIWLDMFSFTIFLWKWRNYKASSSSTKQVFEATSPVTAGAELFLRGPVWMSLAHLQSIVWPPVLRSTVSAFATFIIFHHLSSILSLSSMVLQHLCVKCPCMWLPLASDLNESRGRKVY